MVKVFLGGTVSGVDPLYGWRGALVSLLNVDYFNPVTTKYTKEWKAEEDRQKYDVCTHNLFVITPDIRGFFSIAEATDLSNKHPEKTVFCVLDETFENDRYYNKGQKHSLESVAALIKSNGAHVFYSLEDVANHFNNL